MNRRRRRFTSIQSFTTGAAQAGDITLGRRLPNIVASGLPLGETGTEERGTLRVVLAKEFVHTGQAFGHDNHWDLLVQDVTLEGTEWIGSGETFYVMMPPTFYALSYDGRTEYGHALSYNTPQSRFALNATDPNNVFREEQRITPPYRFAEATGYVGDLLLIAKAQSFETQGDGLQPIGLPMQIGGGGARHTWLDLNITKRAWFSFSQTFTVDP